MLTTGRARAVGPAIPRAPWDPYRTEPHVSHSCAPGGAYPQRMKMWSAFSPTSDLLGATEPGYR